MISRRAGIAAAMLLALGFGCAGCNKQEDKSDKGVAREKGGRPETQASADARTNFVVESRNGFPVEGPIPAKYTADGENVSPPLIWPSPPQGAKEFAILVEDRDAATATPDKQPWAHWIVYKIPASARGVPENVPHDGPVGDLAGAVQGKNSWGQTFYRGPEPPKGSGQHHYIFRVYALEAPLDVSTAQGPLDRAALLKAMEGHTLSHGETVGIYERK